MEELTTQGQLIPCQDIQSQEWHAFINRMPPPPDNFYVIGEVYVSNPGVDPILVYREPQGINPEILLLDLLLIQKPGVWPRVMTWKPVRYDKIGNVPYTKVNVFCGSTIIADIDVQVVH